MANDFQINDDVIDKAIGAVDGQRINSINQGLDADPDKAAMSVQLQEVTGRPAPAILGDYDNYTAQLKAASARGLVLGNPDLRAYVDSDPMAGSVSNDDWANLDQYTREASTLAKLHKALNAPFAKIGEEMERGMEAGWVGSDFSSEYAKYTDPAQNIMGYGGAAVAQAVYGTANLLLKAMGAGFGATVGAAKGLGETIGGERVGREAEAMTQWAMMRGDIPLHGAEVEPAPRLPGKIWIDSGVEPPRGVDPKIDEIKAAINSQAVDALEKNLESATASTTRERSPEMFAKLSQQLYGDTSIGIHPDAVLALYGDKVPTPDDGLLGWVPNIESQLMAARDIGSDIEVPLRDWFAKIDPQVAKGLHDDIRVWPGGITAREAAEPIPQKAVIDAALPQVRDVSGLEPKFSIGDRKLQLLKGQTEANQWTEPFGDKLDTWQIADENGQHVGDLEIARGDDKTLYVNMINGVAGMWANSFGPALMRDLKRQLREAYPDYEYLTGHRVSGAREASGAADFGPMPLPRVKLAVDWNDPVELMKAEYYNMQRVLTNAYYYKGYPQTMIDEGNGVRSTVLPPEGTPARAQADKLGGIITDEINRITGNKADVRPTMGIRYDSSELHGKTTGMFLQKQDRPPTILFDLLGHDPMGIGRHEAIHMLRSYNFLTDKEWDLLATACIKENWAARYNIWERYRGLTGEEKREEAIADAYREWAGQQPEVRPKTGVGAVFQKIMDLFDAIKAKLGFGPEETWESVFQKIHSGEVGARPAGEPRAAGAFDIRESIEGFDNLKAESLGIDAATFKRIQAAMEKQHEADIEKAQKRAMAEQTKRQGAEWKANRAEMAKTVAADIRQRPDIAADLFLGNGELFGKKLRQRYTLAADELTPEQRAALPDVYISKNGLPPDQVAQMFGYSSGTEMVDRLAQLEVAKRGADGKRMPTGEFLRQTIQAETDRQMEREYGFLEKNIMEDARNQALSEASFNVMHEQLMAAALKGGVTAFDKDTIKQAARDLINEQTIGRLSSYKLMQQMGKHSRDAEKALAAGDWQSAALAMQKQTVTMAVAQEARAVEKDLTKFNKEIKKYVKPYNPIKNQAVEGNFSIFNRDILQRVGLKNGMSPAWLQESIAKSGFVDLTDFINKTEKTWEISGVELPVPDFILNNKSPGNFKEMNVEDAKAVMGAVRALDRFGRDINTVEREGAKQDKAEWVAAAGKQLSDKFEPIGIPATKKLGDKISHVFNTAVAASTNNETLMQRFDGRDPHGIFTETITYPAAEAANYEAKLHRETAQALAELGKIKDPNKLVKSPFIDPMNKELLKNFTRSNLMAVVSNMGNDYNWKTLAKGWGVDPDMLMKWVEANTTVEDIQRAQKLAEVFKGLKTKSDIVYQNMYGVAPESVQPRPFTMHGQRFDGWYHPVIGDAERSKFVNKLEMESPNTFWPSTSNKYTKRRTGADQVVDLSYDMIPVRLGQEIHDIAFRQVVHDIAKIFKDNTFRQDVTRYYGHEYMEEMDQWLKRIAGIDSYTTGALGLANKISDNIRQNVVSSQIAFNLGTVEKHGLTAWAMSARELGPNLFKTIPLFAKITAEVGIDSFHHAVMDLFGHDQEQGESLWRFARNTSEEIQRRDRNYLDTMIGQQRQLEGQTNLRAKVSQAGAKLVAFSDMLSAVPLWIAKYREEMEANGGVHGDAVRVADLAVRRAHGSTAITSLPRIATGNNPITPWMTSLYGFMGTSMQRRIEMFHDINDMYKLGMKGDINGAAAKVPQILSSAAVYIVWTGLVEEAITGQFTDDRRGLGAKALAFAFSTAAQSIIGLRDLVHDIETGSDSGGLISTPIHDFINLNRDIHKTQPLSKEHAGKLVQDGITAIGDLWGVGPKHIGTAIRYGIDAFDGYQRPRDAADIYRGVVSGQQKLRVVK